MPKPQPSLPGLVVGGTGSNSGKTTLTLALLCADLGVEAADVIAFGDMPNDLPMLAWAGTSYAMADAHPDVAAVARHRAPSNADAGVVTVIEGLLGD